jgi:hypothetical protein
MSSTFYEATKTPVLLNGFGQLSHMGAEAFRPIYSARGGWPPVVSVAGYYLGLLSSFYWLIPIRDRTGRMASLCFMIVCFYFALMAHAAPWYLPSATSFGLVVLSKGLFSYAGVLQTRLAAANKLAMGVATVVCLGWTWMFGLSTWEMAVQQRVIETANRQQIGLWLKDHMKAGERVYLEPLGYIGFFSGAKMLDYPGLAAPEVVQAQKQGIRGFVPVGLHLKPEWMVLRPHEAQNMSQSEEFSTNYLPVQAFDVSAELDRYPDLPGIDYLRYDAIFVICKRTAATAEGPEKPQP